MVVRSRRDAGVGGLWPPIVLFLSGLLGGIVGAGLAQASVTGELRVSYFFLGPLPFFFSAALWAGGVLAGWLVAATMLTRAPGLVRCPRCGTPNDKQAELCQACDLALA